MTLQQVSDILGSMCLELSFSSDIDSAAVQPAWSDRFVLTAEDYLHGVITLVNELVSQRDRSTRRTSLDRSNSPV